MKTRTIERIENEIKSLELENETTSDLNRRRVIRRTLHVLITTLQSVKLLSQSCFDN